MLLALAFLAGALLVHHDMPEAAHGMAVGMICLAVLSGTVGLAVLVAQERPRPRIVRVLRPLVALAIIPAAAAPARAGPDQGTVVLRR